MRQLTSKEHFQEFIWQLAPLAVVIGFAVLALFYPDSPPVTWMVNGFKGLVGWFNGNVPI